MTKIVNETMFNSDPENEWMSGDYVISDPGRMLLGRRAPLFGAELPL